MCVTCVRQMADCERVEKQQLLVNEWHHLSPLSLSLRRRALICIQHLKLRMLNVAIKLIRQHKMHLCPESEHKPRSRQRG